MMTHIDSRIEQVAKAWINPRMITDVEAPAAPIDMEILFDLFDRYNSITHYAGGGGGRGGGGKGGGGQARTGTGQCCASGTCDIFA